ncbi:PAS domain-containing protein [Sinorhizobium numidicum]|uniref:Blue-light-activated histidine kinase n=1 Tax=Sinorhizobium numidicum TaxID=680248 RepID=A0ABY8CW13_9HYPH|nr:CheR family methyltransferase [Sinorhizobium numidicum]WEX76160.1 PAS domain-containing protein [Sinorhizobium numidicum]WEX82819.1 PAS domain-containing protein [Sinorhizobium numidicum]
MTSAYNKFPIVGIGASAGGIPAMEGFFRGLPAGTNMAFVIVTHLSPERVSLLHEVVGRYTDMPVFVAEDGMTTEPGHVYVMPQNTILSIDDGRLRVRRPNATNRERKPIDIFLSTLAEDKGEHAVGIILSGADGDGTLGAKAIKERGGLTIAQASDSTGPRNPDMPQSAISSGVIDIAVPADQMGEKLVAFAHSFNTLQDLAGQEAADLQQARAEIYALLRSHSGHDFSGYKPKTFLRRVKRRMQILQLQTLPDYINLLRSDSAEVTNLFRDLLINVTNFFRDPDAFNVLDQLVIPRLFEGRGASDTVRVWVPGCATGEEVYSLGILMREHMEKLSEVPRVQIFATDIDEPALSVARAGRYPAALLQGLTPERKQRYFNNDGSSFVISNDVRELCVFSPHSVTRDPPFSRMDMVSCRNLLIYLSQEMQNRVIPTFHYSLKPGGYLFLGTSESISQHGDLFSTLDKKNRIFQAREHASVVPRLPALAGEPRTVTTAARHGDGGRVASYPLRQAVEAHVLERFAPAHVVVNGDGEAFYYSARTGKYLELPQGAPSRQILTTARRGLRLDLRAALREAVSTQNIVVRENVVIDDDDDRVQSITLTVEPLANRGAGEPLYLIVFDPAGPAQSRVEAQQRGRGPNVTTDLERELRETRERLQSTIEEYETALEELKASNEELVSVNEEAQSTNEELEASKEEMQSLNEELSTINAELSGKIEELDHANSDLKNLFESTQIATVFLDRNLVIRNFTPAASSFFNIRLSDIGRPLTELSSKLDYPELKEQIASVFKTGDVMEHRVARDGDGKHYLVRLIPYRDEAARIEGVVVTVVDVTRMAEAEAHQQTLVSELNHRVKNMLAVVISIANHTLEGSRSPREFHAALNGRLQAMARAYGLLTQSHWTEAPVEDLVRQELEAFGSSRFELRGPDLRLNPQQGLSVGMAIHELATNASKYGALSKSEGKVLVEWELANDRFRLAWQENDGPPVTKPEKEGFGLSLLKGEIGYRLDGEVETLFRPEGLLVRISFPYER